MCVDMCAEAGKEPELGGEGRWGTAEARGSPRGTEPVTPGLLPSPVSFNRPLTRKHRRREVMTTARRANRPPWRQAGAREHWITASTSSQARPNTTRSMTLPRWRRNRRYRNTSKSVTENAGAARRMVRRPRRTRRRRSRSLMPGQQARPDRHPGTHACHIATVLADMSHCR